MNSPHPQPLSHDVGEGSSSRTLARVTREGGAAAPGEGSFGDLLTTFTARSEALGVRVVRVATSEEATFWLENLRTQLEAPTLAISSEVAAAAPDLMAALDAARVAWSTPADPAEARDAPLGISIAKLAVAETGSVLLTEESLAARSVGMLSLAHVVICRTADLVPSLDEAAIALKEIATRPGGGYATLATGPSRTADIELSLTIGVQGPARVFVLFVDNLS